MKSHKEYPKEYIGSSDYSTLITMSPFGGAREITFGEDGSYYAYIVDEKAEIPRHYKFCYSGSKWLKIYDDDRLVKTITGEDIRIYRAQMRGCIIQILD